MFKSLVKNAFRNITHKFGYSFINILGMTLGIASALFLMSDWLQNYVYRTEIGPLVFLWTVLLILLPTAITISYRSYKAATANPANSMRSE